MLNPLVNAKHHAFVVKFFLGHQGIGGRRVAKYKVLFHLDEGAMSKWKLVLANIENLLADLGEEAEVELLTNAEGVGIVYKQPNPFTGKIENLASQGVIFAVCGNTVKQFKLPQEFLLECAKVVTSGVGEIVRKQAEGWIYIRP